MARFYDTEYDTGLMSAANAAGNRAANIDLGGQVAQFGNKILTNARQAEADRIAKEDRERKINQELATNAAMGAILTPQAAAQATVSPETGQRLLEQYTTTGNLDMGTYNQIIGDKQAVGSTKDFLLADTNADQSKILSAMNTQDLMDKRAYDIAVATPGTPEHEAAQKSILGTYESKKKIDSKYAKPDKSSTDAAGLAAYLASIGGKVGSLDNTASLKLKIKQMEEEKKGLREKTAKEEEKGVKILEKVQNPGKYLSDIGGIDMDTEARAKVSKFLKDEGADTPAKKKVLLDKILSNYSDSILPGIWDTDLEDTLDKLSGTNKY